MIYMDRSQQPPLLDKYFVIFNDDFPQKWWIFLMQKKDETFSMFLKFKALVEKEIENKVNPLRSDNGGEYVPNEFKTKCAKEWIRWELTTPHNPQ